MKYTTLALIVALLAPLTVVAADYTGTYISGTGYIEHVVLFPARSNQSQTLGADYPDIGLYAPGANLPELTSLDFDASAIETMDFMWHPLHHATRAGTAYIDIHYSMATAHAGTVRMTFQVWPIAPGADLASLPAAAVSTSWTIDPRDTARTADVNFYGVGYSGSIIGTNMGQFDMGALGLTTIQNECLCRLTREADDGTNDTHTGDLCVYRVELHYKVNPYALTIGE